MKHDINTVPVVKQLKELKVGDVFETIPPKKKIYLVVKLDSSNLMMYGSAGSWKAVLDIVSDRVTILKSDINVQVIDNVRLTNKVD
ncbi:DNA helicase [Escherichia phage vB_EcoP_EcoN5]|uniref:DNA helicase n=1 Tax=Escherichia phage vB_EcoP_EcoN5 TaxID=2686238 RepID=A0A7L4XTG2_9CAUD|nr:DNA helicase [Escherichia phage vB_EcoP_EcoN5]QGZ13810.1 DNA helicase [Escherichia phage vB_EcoP_EcoN5]